MLQSLIGIPFLVSRTSQPRLSSFQYPGRSYYSQHPVILDESHPITKLLVHSEHIWLLQSGITLLSYLLGHRLHIIGGFKVIRSVTLACVNCWRVTAKSKHQMLGKLPVERMTPDIVFNKPGIDYAGPLILMKVESTCRIYCRPMVKVALLLPDSMNWLYTDFVLFFFC